MASIIPDVNATPEHADKVRAWSSIGLKALDASSFAKIMTEVRCIHFRLFLPGILRSTLAKLSRDVSADTRDLPYILNWARIFWASSNASNSLSRTASLEAGESASYLYSTTTTSKS